MKNVSFRRNGVEFEPTKQELKIVLDDFAKQLGERDKRIAELEKQLKTFLEKWEWLDLEDADKTLSESEQKIWELMQKNAQLEAEYKEHQELMHEADNTIKVLDKALELACANHPGVCDKSMDCSNGVDCVECLIEHYKTEARKELKNE